MTRIKTNWERLVTDEDTVIIPGDVSWALSLEEAVSDLKFIDSLPGKKILGKGNHDFWWCTMKKHSELFEKHGISTISFLFNNAHETEDYIIAGTRGWYHDCTVRLYFDGEEGSTRYTLSPEAEQSTLCEIFPEAKKCRRFAFSLHSFGAVKIDGAKIEWLGE